jgi:hypothetical protein
MKREEYRKFQWLASVCIAVFILSFAVCLLAFNRSVYRLSSTDYRNGVTVEISKAEAELYYGQIADSYCRFFTGKYRIAGYELSDENVHQLNRLKVLPVRMDFIHCIAGWDDIQFSQALAQAGDDAVFLWKCRRRVSGGAFDAADRDIKKRGLCRTSEYDIPWRLWLFFFRRCAV